MLEAYHSPDNLPLTQGDPMTRTLRGNRIPIPEIRQKCEHTCGPAVLGAILNYWGDIIEEIDLAIELEADPVEGTSPIKINSSAISRGYNTVWHEHMTNQELKFYLENGRPVIIAIQAWASTPRELAGDSGHYVIAIDYDEDNAYFEDPALDNSRGYIPWEDMEARWYDIDKSGVPYKRFGLAIWKDSLPVLPEIVEPISMILQRYITVNG